MREKEGDHLVERLSVIASLTEAEERRVDARQVLLEATLLRGMGREEVEGFVVAYRQRAAGMPEWVHTEVKKVSTSTLYRWQSAYQHGGRSGLAPKWGKRATREWGSHWERHPNQVALINRLLWEHGSDVGPTFVRHSLEAHFGSSNVPCTATVGRYLKRWQTENPQVADKLAMPNEWKGRHRVAIGRADSNVNQLNEVWEVDTTPSDILLRYQRPDGAEAQKRFKILAALEVYSRMAAVKVVPSESTGAIVGFLREVILAWRRFPVTVRTDQGSAFTSRFFRDTLRDLEIHHHVLPPGAPEKKPFVERFLRTLNEGLMPILPGFVGANVAARRKIEERQKRLRVTGLSKGQAEVNSLLSVEELQVACDDWLHRYNYERVHSTIKMCPSDKVAQWSLLGLPVRGFAEEEVGRYEQILAAFLAPAASTQGKPPGVRMVRKGTVRVEGVDYTADELSAAWNGREVVCRYDVTDLSRIYVYAPDRRFLCVALGCDVVGGVSREEAARVAARVQADYVRKALKEVRKEARKIQPRAAARALKEAREMTPSVGGTFETVSPDVPGFAGAEKAAAILRGGVERPLSEENGLEVRAEIERVQSEPGLRRPEFWGSSDERYRWCKRAADADAIELVTDADRLFIAKYERELLDT